jgi:hypothetical protein
MKSVIGLFEQRSQAEAAANAIRKVGVIEDRIKILDNASPADDLVEPSPREVTMKWVRNFGLLGLGIFAIFGLFSAIFAMTVTDAPASVAIALFLVFLVVGLFCGVFLGWVKGRSDAGQEIQLFREAFEQGSVILSVQTEKYAKDAARIMEREHAEAVYVSKQANPMELMPAAEPTSATVH